MGLILWDLSGFAPTSASEGTDSSSRPRSPASAVQAFSYGPQPQGAEPGRGGVTWRLPRPQLVCDRRAWFLLGHQVNGPWPQQAGVRAGPVSLSPAMSAGGDCFLQVPPAGSTAPNWTGTERGWD